MGYFLTQRHLKARSILLLVICCALYGLAGCQVYPDPPRRKPLQELYYEAVNASGQAPDRLGMVPGGMVHAPSSMLTPQPQTDVLPPVLPADSELTPEPVPPPSTMPRQEPVPLLPELGSPGQQYGPLGWSKSGDRDSRSGHRNERSGYQGHRGQEQPLRPVGWETETGLPLVTEFLEETDVRQAIQSIASQAEVDVIIDEQVGGVVSAIIEDETFESALRKILMPIGLVYRQTGDREFLIGLADPQSVLFSRLAERREFRPQHLGPEELFKLVPEREQKFLNVIDGRNRILVEAPPELADSIVDRLRQFDSPIPQVELEAIVCVVSPDTEFQSGLDWGHAVPLNGSDLLRLGMTGLAFSGAGSGAGLTDAFSNFAVTSAFVKLLAQEGYLAIRAAPRVTAQDGEQARIAITRESFFSTQPNSDNAFFRQEIEQVQAGIELSITPVVRGDNITVKIEKAEVSEDLRTSQLNTSITENPYPQINRRSVQTTVHVKDGETIVIGGLVQRQTVDRVAQIPVLGRMPGLGRIFQTVERREQDAEVIIFISPRLVEPSGSPTTP